MEKTTQPFVTLLCSNFNSAKWIEGYLECINNQIEKHIAIVFVDAGSTDGSLKTIKDFKFREGIASKVIEKPGCTIYEAWNIAIDNSTTEYVMNFNTDDRLFNYALVTAKHVAKQNPDADMVYFPCFMTGDAEHQQMKGYHRREIPFDIKNLKQHCICGPFPLLKREAINELGGFDESLKISGDYEMWMRMAHNGKKLLPSIEPIGSYYDNPVGMSTDPEKHSLHVKEDNMIRNRYSKKVISFSLWGDNPVYAQGAIRNAELALTVYPGWVCRFYVGTSTPEDVVSKLEAMDNCEVVRKDEAGDWTGMFWRFEAAADPTVDIMLSRDCDSRLNSREKAAVDEWLASDKSFHIMRDHPYHGTEILGGMWGTRGMIPGIQQAMDSFEKGDYWQVDQNFLKTIYEQVGPFAHVHDEFFEKKPFPTTRKGKLFVGQAYNEYDVPLHPEHMDVIT